MMMMMMMMMNLTINRVHTVPKRISKYQVLAQL